mmetsp:Transcript_4545/g.7797  ORF Transcript_4545/g.7797 Transcript_4545/m.7797 type:complete len:319 (+) Transcript_4545:1227-2183(+)
MAENVDYSDSSDEDNNATASTTHHSNPQHSKPSSSAPFHHQTNPNAYPYPQQQRQRDPPSSYASNERSTPQQYSTQQTSQIRSNQQIDLRYSSDEENDAVQKDRMNANAPNPPPSSSSVHASNQYQHHNQHRSNNNKDNNSEQQPVRHRYPVHTADGNEQGTNVRHRYPPQTAKGPSNTHAVQSNVANKKKKLKQDVIPLFHTTLKQNPFNAWGEVRKYLDTGKWTDRRAYCIINKPGGPGLGGRDKPQIFKDNGRDRGGDRQRGAYRGGYGGAHGRGRGRDRERYDEGPWRPAPHRHDEWRQGAHCERARHCGGRRR